MFAKQPFSETPMPPIVIVMTAPASVLIAIARIAAALLVGRPGAAREAAPGWRMGHGVASGAPSQHIATE